jgi:hypothetical protein
MSCQEKTAAQTAAQKSVGGWFRLFDADYSWRLATKQD